MDNFTRPGTCENYAWLQTLGSFFFFHGDVRNGNDLEAILRKRRVHCICHLAGQVAVTTSLDNPRRDFGVNVLSSISVLESVRLNAPAATVVYASSNKVYGELEGTVVEEMATRYEPRGKKDVDERARLEFYTPYGCSKGRRTSTRLITPAALG